MHKWLQKVVKLRANGLMSGFSAKAIFARAECYAVIFRIARVVEKGQRLFGYNRLVVQSNCLKNDHTSSVRAISIFLARSCGKLTPVMDIVEKSTSNKNEFKVYDDVLSGKVGGDLSLFPKIYYCANNEQNGQKGFNYLIAMERIRLLEVKELDDDVASKIADAMTVLWELRVSHARNRPKTSNFITQELRDNFNELAKSNLNGLPAEACRELHAMNEEWHFVQNIDLSRIPTVPCHHDLHLQNLGLRTKSEEVVFTDWAHFGFNFLGADLHHMIRYSIYASDLRDFTEKICSRYIIKAGEFYNLGTKEINLASHYYTMFRCMRLFTGVKKLDPLIFKQIIAVHQRIKDISAIAA